MYKRQEQGSGLAGDDGAVGQLDGGRGRTGLICALECGGGDRTVRGGYVRLIHQQLELAHAALVAETHADIAERLIVAADDLLAGGLAAGIVVDDAVARHVDAHIGRGMIGTFAGDPVSYTHLRGIGTRSQQALQLAREQSRLEKRESSRARRQAEQARRFALRTEKRREKHRGH